jgi:hypothetical protein
VARLYLQALGSVFVASYGSQGYGGGIRPRLHTWFLEKTKLHGLSPQANYTDRLSDRRLLAKSVPTLADRGCRVVSATVPPQSLI